MAYYKIIPPEVSEDFQKCLKMASEFFEQKGKDSIYFVPFSSSPTPVHLAFTIGNQLLFIHFVDVDEILKTPGDVDSFINICKKFNSQACLLPVRKNIDKWTIENPDWGLIDALTNKVIDVYDIVTDEKIPMNDYELHEIGNTYIREEIQNLGYRIDGFVIDKDLIPSIFFEKSKEYCGVLVKVFYGPDSENIYEKINDFKDLIKEAENLNPEIKKIYFAAVHLTGQEQFEKKDFTLPIYRGQRFRAVFVALQIFDDDKIYKKINEAIKIQDKKLAFKLSLKLAEQGYVEKQASVSSCYAKGYGIKENPEEAFKWIYRSGKRYYVPAFKDLGYSYKVGYGIEKDEKEAFKWFELSSQHEDNEGLFQLGLCYEQGIGTKKDYKKASEIFRSLMKKNHLDGICRLGSLYLQGLGVSQDFKEAVRLIKIGVEKNHPVSQNFLAKCYKYGYGVKQDNIKALMWYFISIKNGYEDYEELLDEIAENLTTTDIEKAENLAKKYLKDKN